MCRKMVDYGDYSNGLFLFINVFIKEILKLEKVDKEN